MPFAPVVLFVYNRPHHTLRVLRSLKENTLAEQSRLTIFCDGAKAGAGDNEARLVEEVRRIASSEKWCGEVNVVKRDGNRGLVPSILEGVTNAVREHGQVIVLEDDMVTGKGFLSYMNDSLQRYSGEKEVMHVSGYMYPRLRLPFSGYSQGTNFVRFMSCWGWATWKHAWDHYSDSAPDLLQEIEQRGDLDRFNLDGQAVALGRQLKNNADGTLHTWAIKWYASIFLREGLCLYPSESLVHNIGADGTGTHPDKTNLYSYQELSDGVRLANVPLVESAKARRQIGGFFHFLEKKKSLRDKLIEKLRLLR